MFSRKEYLELNGECSIFVQNLTETEYMAFTKPDPDGNSTSLDQEEKSSEISK